MCMNETITLVKGNGGLQIDVSRMKWDGENVSALPSWKVLYFSASEIAESIAGAGNGLLVTFTEDDFERFLAGWLEREYGNGHKLASFRWLWDKVRDFKVVA